MHEIVLWSEDSGVHSGSPPRGSDNAFIYRRLSYPPSMNSLLRQRTVKEWLHCIHCTIHYLLFGCVVSLQSANKKLPRKIDCHAVAVLSDGPTMKNLRRGLLSFLLWSLYVREIVSPQDRHKKEPIWKGISDFTKFFADVPRKFTEIRESAD